MTKDDTVYLRHILDRIRRIEEDTVDGRERFMASHTLQDAVLRSLQIMADRPNAYLKRRKRHSHISSG